METQRTWGIVALLFAIGFGPAGLAIGQTDVVELRRQRSMLQFQKQLETLEGRDAYQDDKIQLILDRLDAHDVNHEDVMAILKPLADWVRLKEQGDQKDAFFKEFIEWACKNIQDNCELRQQFAILEARIAELEGRNDDSLEPTPAEPTPAEPPLEPEPSPGEPPWGPIPVPWRPEGSLVPPPTIPPWDGSLDYFTDQRESFCQNAELVARCINCQFADGSVHHGDVYLTCRGNYVLLRHAPRVPIQHVLVYR